MTARRDIHHRGNRRKSDLGPIAAAAAVADNESRARVLTGPAARLARGHVHAAKVHFSDYDSREHEVRQNKTSVVLADDDAPLLRALARLVSLGGFRPLVFSRPGDVLRARLPKRRGCLVLDLFMPGMDGVELFRALRAAGNRLPVVLITGRQDEHSQTLIGQIEPVAVLYKPFAVSELLRAIAHATGRSPLPGLEDL